MSEIKNDDVIVFNTEHNAPQKQEVQTFQLVDPNSPILHQALPEFDFDNKPVDPNQFASTLVESCKKMNGLGLSANQCGYPFRVFVMGTGDDYIACFNPKVISSEGEAHMPEGCLSFPMLNLNITRAQTITVEYQDWTGEKHTATYTGMTARVFLHELDHMNGIVYTTRAKPLALKSGMKKVEKIYRKYFSPQQLKKLQHGNQKANPGHR
jgi:peptide deformylase